MTALAILAALPAAPAGAAELVGLTEMEIGDGARTMEAAIWYPTADAAASETIVGHEVFVGFKARRDAKPLGQPRRLVVISHGYGGSWHNLAWLARELAPEGYVVAAPNHPGTTTFDMDPKAAAELWERPRDLSLATTR